MHIRTYRDCLDLEAVIEHFFDSFPEEWGELFDVKDEEYSHVEDSYEAIAVMDSGTNFKVEIFFADDADDSEPWVCKASKVS